MGAQRIEHTFQPPKGYKLKKRRRWPWVLLAVVVVIAAANAVAPKEERNASSTAATPATPLAIGATGTTSGFDVTLVQAIDPWVAANQFEQPATDRRFVAVELTMTNTRSEMQTFSTLLGLELVDSLGRHWDAGIAGIDLPQLGGDLAPGSLIRGWQVFEVGADSTGLQLVVKGSITASGTTFAL